jgi:tetratricopeptide (TPR) repeat protein
MAVALFVGGPAGASASQTPATTQGRREAPPEVAALAEQAAKARAAGRTEEAVRAYSQALARRPDWIEGHWDLGTLLYDLGRVKDAREHFRSVVAAHQDEGLFWAMAGLCDFRLEDYDVALADLQRARALGIKSAAVYSTALFDSAVLLNRAGVPDAAFELLREFAAQGKDSPSVIVVLGLSLLRWRMLPEDVPADKRALVELAGRAAYHMARGRPTPIGRLAFEELVTRYPTEPNVHYARGLYLASDDPAAALDEFQRELRISGDHYLALVQIATLQLRQGNQHEALAAAERAAQLAPDLAATHLVLGRTLLETGETQRAVAELERAAALSPHTRNVLFALSRAYERAGRQDDARKARQEFLELERRQEGQSKAPPGAQHENGGSQ